MPNGILHGGNQIESVLNDMFWLIALAKAFTSSLVLKLTIICWNGRLSVRAYSGIPSHSFFQSGSTSINSACLSHFLAISYASSSNRSLLSQLICARKFLLHNDG